MTSTNLKKTFSQEDLTQLTQKAPKIEKVMGAKKVKLQVVSENVAEKEKKMEKSNPRKALSQEELERSEQKRGKIEKIIDGKETTLPVVSENVVEKEKEMSTQEKTQKILEDLLSNVRFNDKIDKYYFYSGGGYKEYNPKEIQSVILQEINNTIKAETDKEVINELKSLTKKTNLTQFLLKIDKIEIDSVNNASDCVNAKNGYFGLTQNKILEFDKNSYMISSLGTLYDPKAKAPIWEKFILDIASNNEEYAHFLQKVVGYCLTNLNVEQCGFFLVGTGANGKTVFAEILKTLFGSFSVVIDKQILLKESKKSLKEHVNLIGKRIAILNELDDNAKIKIDTFKRLTGGDTIGFEHAKKYIEFNNKAKMFILTNTFPQIDDITLALWRRIKILPFENEFIDESRNLFLIEELKQELPGILNWAIQGYNNWKTENGLGKCKIVDEKHEEYHNNADDLFSFIGERCTTQEGEKCFSCLLYDAYKSWCKHNQIEPFGQNKFGTMLIARGFKPTRMSNGERGYIGIQTMCF